MVRLKTLCAGLGVALTIAGCGASSKKPATRTATGPRTGSTATTSATSAASATSATGSTSTAAALSDDQAAEQLAHSAATAAMTYGTNSNGNYSGMTAASLHSLASGIQVGPGTGNAYVSSSGGVTILDSGAGFTVTATSATGDTFSIGESATGTPTQSCTGTASTACQSGSW